MSTHATLRPDPSRLRQWYENLKQMDPSLYEELHRRFELEAPAARELALESAGAHAAAQAVDVALETIVRDGRPSLFIQNDRIRKADPDSQIDAPSQLMIDRMMAASSVLEPLFPLVGRIDVQNFPASATYVGTGWVVAEEDGRSIVVTNRHVADLIAREEAGRFTFKPGRFGERIAASLNYRAEYESAEGVVAKVERVLWIEKRPKEADIAFLLVAAGPATLTKRTITIADQDAKPGRHVAVIGYPARAPSDIIPDQDRMDRIYGRVYDVKRIAPGQVQPDSRGWAAHDCTTLGGNSGSVVVDIATGNAVALHFAGLYLVENYAVPASTIRRYMKERPWQGSPKPAAPPKNGGRAEMTVTPSTPSTPQGVRVAAQPTRITVHIPLTLTIDVGPITTGSASTHGVTNGVSSEAGSGAAVRAAAQEFAREHAGGEVLAARRGFLVEGGELTDTQCVVVAVDPDQVESVRAALPGSYRGYPVDVRPASIADQLGVSEPTITTEAATTIAYDDERRKGDGFSFGWIKEDMTVRLHVGPERSWRELKQFITQAQKKLVSSIYEFHAAHIADAIEERLENAVRLKLVLARQSRDPSSDEIPAGDFDRSERFERWENQFGEKFKHVFVPTGSNGLVAVSYHIKVTVRDGKAVWLSSGNWKRSSQPLIVGDADDPRVTNRAGNREWHVVIENKTLATRLENHILADYERSLELGGTLEGVEPQLMVDVPIPLLEGVELEGPPERVIETVEVSRVVRVKPLLTPDRNGGIYSRAVLQLIRSARRELVFQNQYITLGSAESGYPLELMDALAERAREIESVRIILRSGGSDFWDQVAELKYRGVDVDTCVRRLPSTHTKGIVVDGKRVLVGSHNWSGLGVTLNRDASLIFDDRDVAQFYLGVFNLDWDRASPLPVEEAVAEAAPRLAVGDAPPPGFKRMPLSDFLEG